MPLTPLLGLLLVMQAPIIRVAGNARCPTPADLSARVAELLPGSSAGGAPDDVTLDEDARGLTLTLRRPGGEIVGQRFLERTSSCADLAAAAAVVVAIWESDVHPEFASRIEPADGPPAAATQVTAPEPQGPTTFDLGAALLGSLAPASGEAGPGAGLMLVASWTARSDTFTRWGLRTSLSAGLERELALGVGFVSWRRLVLAAGPHLRMVSSSRTWILDLHADALAARTNVRGEGFQTNVPESFLEGGLGAGVRLMLHRSAVAPWVGLGVTGWLQPQVPYANSNAVSTTSTTLPRLEASLALGVSFCQCP